MKAKIIFLLTSIIIVSSCNDGLDGDIYLKIKVQQGYCFSLVSYNDDNSGIPYGFTEDYYYQCNAGTYSYSYTIVSSCGYGSYNWTGTYTLYPKTGEAWSGKLGYLKQAKNGDDRFFDLSCNFDKGYLTTKSSISTEPVLFDTTYYTNGNKIRVTGKITIGNASVSLPNKVKLKN